MLGTETTPRPAPFSQQASPNLRGHKFNGQGNPDFFKMKSLSSAAGTFFNSLLRNSDYLCPAEGALICKHLVKPNFRSRKRRLSPLDMGRLRTHILTHTLRHTLTHTYTLRLTHTHTHINTLTLIHIYTHIHTHTHTHMLTHTLSHTRVPGSKV